MNPVLDMVFVMPALTLKGDGNGPDLIDGPCDGVVAGPLDDDADDGVGAATAGEAVDPAMVDEEMDADAAEAAEADAMAGATDVDSAALPREVTSTLLDPTLLGAWTAAGACAAGMSLLSFLSSLTTAGRADATSVCISDHVARRKTGVEMWCAPLTCSPSAAIPVPPSSCRSSDAFLSPSLSRMASASGRLCSS